MFDFTENDLKYFAENIYSKEFEGNKGMGAPDLFSFWYILKTYNPKVVVESGVWNGTSTKLIRKTLPETKIICLDPRAVPYYGYTDNNVNTTYYTGNNFKDFENLKLDSYDQMISYAFLTVIRMLIYGLFNV